MLKINKVLKRIYREKIKTAMLVLTGSIYGFVLVVSSICSAASYPKESLTPLAIDLSMNQYKLNDVGDIITKGPWVDVRAYTSFSAAIDAIGASNKTLLIPNTQTVSANKTVPTNVHLLFLEGGSLSINTGVTVTINGPLDAPLAQIFSGSSPGNVIFGGSIRTVYAEWWYSGSGVWNTAINSAFSSGGRTVQFLSKTYTINDELLITWMGFNIKGVHGHIETGSGTIIKYDGIPDATKSILRVLGGYGFSIDDVFLNCGDNAGYGLRLEGDTAINVHTVTCTNLSIGNALTGGLYLGEKVGGLADPMVENLVFTNYYSYDNVKGLVINSQNSTQVVFLGGSFGSPQGAAGKCDYHVYIYDANNCSFYGTQFGLLKTGGTYGIYVVKGSVQIYGGYNEVSPFLKVVNSGYTPSVSTIVHGVTVPATTGSNFDIDFKGDNISLDNFICAGGKVIIRPGSFLSINNTLIKLLINDGEGGNYSNMLLDPYFTAWPLVSWAVTSGTTATSEVTIVKLGAQSIKVLANGVDSYIYQDIAVNNGSRYSELRGKNVTFGALVYCPSTNDKDQYLTISDQITQSDSIIIPKDNAWHNIILSGYVSPSATNVRVLVRVNGAVADTNDVLYINAATLYKGRCFVGF